MNTKKGTTTENKESLLEHSMKRGRLLTTPLPGEEVVITGISGIFPDANNVHELRDKLFNKECMVTANPRWDFQYAEMPEYFGFLSGVDEYDAGFFGVHSRQAQSLDPQLRLLQEKVIEAIFDAGMHPSDLENSRTGVYVGISLLESQKAWFFDRLEPQQYGITGATRFTVANRLSYFLKLKGPSVSLDTACSSSLIAFEHAFEAMRLGEIDNAIVGGTNLCLHPFIALQFATLGILCRRGVSKVFDEAADGYVRAEAIGVLILQKKKEARRSYADVVYAKTNCDGYKGQGLAFPSRECQGQLMKEFYDESNVDKALLSYIEAHCTGTFVGDPEECEAITDNLTENRTTPLLIGSLKSNMGHSECASGVCSVIKCIIAMETGTIPANINFNTPKKGITGLLQGKIKVVTDNTPLPNNNGLIGINSFGVGGANCHALLHWNEKKKIEEGIPQDNLPRIVCVSGRTEEAVTTLLDELKDNPFDVEHIALLHGSFRKHVQNHLYKGYSIVSKSGEICRSTKFFFEEDKDLYLAFGDISEGTSIARDMMCLPTFAKIMHKIQNYVPNLAIENNVIGGIAVQIGLVAILKELNIIPKYYFGYSFGKIVAAYYKNELSLRETVNYALVVDEVSKSQTANESIVTQLKTKLSTSKNRCYLEKLISILTAHKELDYIRHDLRKRAIVLQIGALPLSDLPEKCHILSVFSQHNKNYFTELLEILGSLHQLGFSPDLTKLYPEVKVPVSRGTRMVAPYIKWKHERKWFVPELLPKDSRKKIKTGLRVINILATDSEWSYIQGHVIDGKIIFPVAGYLYLVWETLAMMNSVPVKSTNVVFEGCTFIRPIVLKKRWYIQLVINIQKNSGNFEITENDTPVATGRVYTYKDEDIDDNSWHRPTSIVSNNIGIPLKPKDIYKELLLRGYEYKKEFRALQECDHNVSVAYVKWNQRWVTFLDHFLQLIILEVDTRSLYLPTYIARLSIPVKRHLEWISKTYGDDDKSTPNLDVHCNSVTKVISCGKIELSGLLATHVQRKRNKNKPVLERYTFVPNSTSLSTEESVRVNLQIILENALTLKVKCVELDDEVTKPNSLHLTHMVKSALRDVPLIQSSLKILSKSPIEVADVTVEDRPLKKETDCLLIIATNLITRLEVLNEAFGAIRDKGYVISREPYDIDISKVTNSDVTILTVHRTPDECLVLLQKANHEKQVCYKIPFSGDFSWISDLQKIIKDSPNETMVLHSNEQTSGIIGFINCLRKEPITFNIRCVFTTNERQKFDPNDSFFADQLKKNMAINVCKNGQWGTYRHLLLPDTISVEKEHAYLDIITKGDLSSLKWLEGSLSSSSEESKLIYVHYSALNFKDVMTALGRIGPGAVTDDRKEQESMIGLEFSGKSKNGSRLMGLSYHTAMSTMLLTKSELVFDVPDSWTLEEAATVPMVYITAVYCFYLLGKLKKGESVLIHSGGGGVGQAAITLALHIGCKVFTTVGNSDKREFLKSTFPQLEDSCIGNSRDESFEQMIYRETKGRGVDVVLNSLADTKLITSLRCLARGGRFLEIGRVDMAINSHINTLLLQNDISFHGVMLHFLQKTSPHENWELVQIIKNLLAHGVIKPLNRTVFQATEVEAAYRYMASGKHIGKVLLKIHDSVEGGLSRTHMMQCQARYWCDPDKVYILVGGLGGVGLELADWLIFRGAMKLVLVSRTGFSTGYQHYRIRLWRSYGVVVQVSKFDVAKKSDCQQLIEESEKLGPVDAVFNLAVVLKDALFENQCEENFNTSFGSKALATQHLDELTRKLCPHLRKFVVFSSVSCGRGNAGQTNYGLASSVTERICEERKRNGYPALAIQWGGIGQVGIVAEMYENSEIIIGGTIPQSISSCLECLDTFLTQDAYTIVSSFVVAEKQRGRSAGNIVDSVIHILGINDANSVSPYAALAEIGMDSMTGLEIKQTLEQEFDVVLTPKEMWTMTLARLREIQEENSAENKGSANKSDSKHDMKAILRLVGNQSESFITQVLLKSKIGEDTLAPTLFIFPGLEGSSKSYETLALRLNVQVICLQYISDRDDETILDMAKALLPYIEEHLTKHDPFNIAAFSFGVLIALEVIGMLESKGYIGKIVCIDGAPLMLKGMVNQLNIESEINFQVAVLSQVLILFLPYQEVAKHKEEIFKLSSWDERLNAAVTISNPGSAEEESYRKALSNRLYDRLKATWAYIPSFEKIKSKSRLYKPKALVVEGLAEDYELSALFEEDVEVQIFEGNHLNVIDNEKLAEAIDEFINEKL